VHGPHGTPANDLSSATGVQTGGWAWRAVLLGAVDATVDASNATVGAARCHPVSKHPTRVLFCSTRRGVWLLGCPLESEMGWAWHGASVSTSQVRAGQLAVVVCPWLPPWKKAQPKPAPGLLINTLISGDHERSGRRGADSRGLRHAQVMPGWRVTQLPSHPASQPARWPAYACMLASLRPTWLA